MTHPRANYVSTHVTTEIYKQICREKDANRCNSASKYLKAYLIFTGVKLEAAEENDTEAALRGVAGSLS